MSEAQLLKKMNVLVPGARPVQGMLNLSYLELAVHPAFSFDRIICKDALLTCEDPDALMRRLHIVAKHGCQLVIDAPFGSHDRAEEWQFKRKIFADTLRRYEPEWSFRRRTFYCDGLFFNAGIDPEQLGMAVANLRNVTKGIACEFTAQKPVPDGYKADDPVSVFKMI